MAVRDKEHPFYQQFKKESKILTLVSSTGKKIKRLSWKGKIFTTGSARDAFAIAKKEMKII